MKVTSEKINKKELAVQSLLLLTAQKRWNVFGEDEQKLLSSLAGGSSSPNNFFSIVGPLMKQTEEQRRFFFATVETILKVRCPELVAEQEEESDEEKDEPDEEETQQLRYIQKEALMAIRDRFFTGLWSKLASDPRNVQLVPTLQDWFFRDVQDVFGFALFREPDTPTHFTWQLKDEKQENKLEKKDQIRIKEGRYDRAIQEAAVVEVCERYFSVLQERVPRASPVYEVLPVLKQYFIETVGEIFPFSIGHLADMGLKINSDASKNIGDLTAQRQREVTRDGVKLVEERFFQLFQAQSQGNPQGASVEDILRGLFDSAVSSIFPPEAPTEAEKAEIGDGPICGCETVRKSNMHQVLQVCTQKAAVIGACGSMVCKFHRDQAIKKVPVDPSKPVCGVEIRVKGVGPGDHYCHEAAIKEAKCGGMTCSMHRIRATRMLPKGKGGEADRIVPKDE